MKTTTTTKCGDWDLYGAQALMVKRNYFITCSGHSCYAIKLLCKMIKPHKQILAIDS